MSNKILYSPNEKISLYLVMLILSLSLFVWCSASTLESAEFTNLTPAEIKMNDVTYQMTKNVLSKKDIDSEIGKVTKVTIVVSYLESDNLYKNPNKIFKIKDKKIEDVIGIQINDKIYEATIKKDSSQ